MIRFVLIMALFAVATYLIVRVLQDRGGEAGGQQRGLPRALPKRPAPRKMVAPDDDEDFLRDLERKRRQRNPEDD